MTSAENAAFQPSPVGRRAGRERPTRVDPRPGAPAVATVRPRRPIRTRSTASRRPARYGTARHGTARHGTVRYGTPRPNQPRPRPGRARPTARRLSAPSSGQSESTGHQQPRVTDTRRPTIATVPPAAQASGPPRNTQNKTRNERHETEWGRRRSSFWFGVHSRVSRCFVFLETIRVAVDSHRIEGRAGDGWSVEDGRRWFVGLDSRIGVARHPEPEAPGCHLGVVWHPGHAGGRAQAGRRIAPGTAAEHPCGAAIGA